MGPQNSKRLKYWARYEPEFMTDLFYSTRILIKTKNLKGQFTQNLKNGSDIYEHIQKVRSIFSIWFGVIKCHLIPTKRAAVGRRGWSDNQWLGKEGFKRYFTSGLILWRLSWVLKVSSRAPARNIPYNNIEYKLLNLHTVREPTLAS